MFHQDRYFKILLVVLTEVKPVCSFAVDIEWKVALLMSWVVVHEHQTIRAEFVCGLSAKAFPILVTLGRVRVEPIAIAALEGLGPGAHGCGLGRGRR